MRERNETGRTNPETVGRTDSQFSFSVGHERKPTWEKLRLNGFSRCASREFMKPTYISFLLIAQSIFFVMRVSRACMYAIKVCRSLQALIKGNNIEIEFRDVWARNDFYIIYCPSFLTSVITVTFLILHLSLLWAIVIKHIRACSKKSVLSVL